jgi:DNA repair exonuclease SbcCD ATPase subunit
VKFVRLSIAGFGSLRGEYRFDPTKLTLVVDDNERGKSTLLAAIAAALYGLEDDRRSHRVITPIERWKPWDGGAYGVELEFEHAGERWTVTRDFERGTVSVWDGRGQEATAQFQDGKDEVPVGNRLLGLDLSEFEKCALVRQGELDFVVPAEEKARRASTLHARLESAADTRVGDTNATEALIVLDQALAQYNSHALGTTIKVDNAIQRLEAKKGVLETDLARLDYERNAIAAPLEELATLQEREQAVRERIGALDHERRLATAVDLRRQLDQNEKQKATIVTLRAEAEALENAAHLPPNAEADLRDTVARYEETMRNLEALDQRRREAQRADRETLELEAMQLSQYEGAGADEADRCVALAAEMRQLAEQDEQLRAEIFQFRDALASRGVDPERIQGLQARFSELDEASIRLLRGQSEVALAYQTEVTGLEQERLGATEVLREIDAVRHRRRVPGWLITALGAGLVVGGAVAFVLHASLPLWAGLAFSGAAGLVAGVATLMLGSRARERDRQTALEGLAEAQRRLGQLKGERAQAQIALGELAQGMHYRDPVELLRDWNEHVRITDDFAPALRAEEGLRTLVDRRQRVVEEARRRLDRLGGGTPEPERLEQVASGIRERVSVQRRLGELERTWSRFDDERRVAEATATGLKERAIRVLQTAGLTYDPERPWADHLREMSERLQGRQRHKLLVEELIPHAERALLPATTVARLTSELETVLAERTAEGAADGTSRAPATIEAEAAERRAELDQLQKRRHELRLSVDDVWRRAHAERPEKSAELERVERELVRARRFKAAAELARDTISKVATDTHRRWADHLNERVSQILATLGTRVEQLRFGDDLDFSVRMWNGQPMARGKAVLQLSAGARDQLHLAVRLAVSEYLSRGGEGVPLLVDDAFATSDDTRAAAGMRLLIELSKRHQVILVTCHRGRHETLAAGDAELFATRVQWLDARSADQPNGRRG